MRDAATTVPLGLADLLRVEPLARAETAHLADPSRRIVRVVLAETFERLRALPAHSLVVLHAEAATGGWSLATALHLAWERNASAVVAPRAAMSPSSAVLAERLGIALLVIEADPVDVALALAAQVSAPEAARALRVALCAEKLAEQSSIRGVLGVLNSELAPAPVALTIGTSVAAGRVAAVQERPGYQHVRVRVNGFSGRTWAELVASVPEPALAGAGQVEAILRLARLPLLAAWAQRRMSTSIQAAQEQAAFQLLRRLLEEPAHDVPGAPDADIDAPLWSSELGWRVEGYNRAVWIRPLHPLGQEPLPELTQLVRAEWQQHRPDWPFVPEQDGWISWENSLEEEGAGSMRRALAGIASATRSHGLVLGVGGVHSGVAGLMRSVAEARLAAHAALDAGAGAVEWFDQVGPRAALAWLPLAQIAEVADLCLSDLMAARDRAALVDTVLAVLDCGGSLSAASARLGVHRNTVLSRMVRAKELGLVLEDPAQRLALHVLCYALASLWAGA